MVGVAVGLVEAEQPQRKRTLLGLTELDLTEVRLAVDPCTAEDRADACVCVLQVRGRVAVEGQHAVPVEHVVLDPVRRQVGVLHGADTDHAADGLLLIGRQLGGALAHLGHTALDGLVDELAARAVPFIFLTGYDKEAVDRRYATISLLQKPVDEQSLRQSLSGLLQIKVASPATGSAVASPPAANALAAN